MDGKAAGKINKARQRKYALMILVQSLLIILLFVTMGYADSSVSSTDVTADSFAKGSRLWSVTVGRSIDERLGRISLAQLNINDYILDNLAVHYGATFGYVDAKRTRNGIQGGPEFGMRWHFVKIGR